MKIWMPSIQTETGSTIYVHRLISALNEQDIQVDCQWFPRSFEFCPLFLKNVKPPKGTDIIFANSWSAIGFTNHPQPLISVIHHCIHDDTYNPYKSILQKLYHRTFIRNFEESGINGSDKLVAISNYTAKTVTDIFCCQSPHVIYNSIDTEKYKPAHGNHRKDLFKLVFVGNTSRRKGFDLLPHIMNKLGRQYRLYFTAGLTNNLTKRIPNSECVGHLSEDELINLYRNCHVMLFPTRYEGFGYSVAEAMSCGLPVVTSDCSSMPELIDHGKGGFLCPVDEVDAFVAAIKNLSENETLRKEMGKYNRIKAENYFSVTRMGKEYKNLFELVLK